MERRRPQPVARHAIAAGETAVHTRQSHVSWAHPRNRSLRPRDPPKFILQRFLHFVKRRDTMASESSA